MNRRSFLKVIAGAGLVASVAPTVLVKQVQSNPLLSGQIGRYEGVVIHDMKRQTERFDFGDKIGIGASGMANGKRYRHAALFRMEDWEAMSERQRECIWRLVERRCQEIAAKHIRAGAG